MNGVRCEATRKSWMGFAQRASILALASLLLVCGERACPAQEVAFSTSDAHYAAAEKQLKAVRASDRDVPAMRRLARRHLEASNHFLEKLRGDLKREIDGLSDPQAGDDATRAEAVAELVSDMTQAEFDLARNAKRLADTYKKGSDRYRKQLWKAAEMFEEFFDAHDDLIIGLEAIVQAGVCYRQLEEVELALSCFDSILGYEELVKIPELTDLMHVALKETTILGIEQLEKSGAFAKRRSLFDRLYAYGEMPTDKEKWSSPTGVTAQFYRARYAISAIGLLKKSQQPDDMRLVGELRADARAMLLYVARREGEFQQLAVTMYEAIAGRKVPPQACGIAE